MHDTMYLLSSLQAVLGGNEGKSGLLTLRSFCAASPSAEAEMADRGPLGRAAGPGAEARSTDDGASSHKQTRPEAQNMGQAALHMKWLPRGEKTRQH